MTKLFRSAVMTVLLCLLAMAGVFAQQAQPGATEAPAEAPETKPIPAAQLSERALDVAAFLRNAAIESDFGNEVQAIREDFSTAEKQIDELQSETLRQLKTGGPVSLIEEAEKEWSRLHVRLDRWLRTLSSRADAVGSVLEKVHAEKELWMLTRESFLDEELPPELKQGIREVLDTIDGTEKQIRSSRDSIFNLQVSVGDAKALADQILADQRAEIRERRRNILKPDSEPLWAAFSTPGVRVSLFEEIAATWRNNYATVLKYFSAQRFRSQA